MNEPYLPGSFGQAVFKSKTGHPITVFGTITKVNGEYVLFQDNDDITFKIDKKGFEFTEHDKNERHAGKENVNLKDK